MKMKQFEQHKISVLDYELTNKSVQLLKAFER